MRGQPEWLAFLFCGDRKKINALFTLGELRPIACDNSQIGTSAKRVDDRNESAHSNGNIFFSTQAARDAKINEILYVVTEC